MKLYKVLVPLLRKTVKYLSGFGLRKFYPVRVIYNFSVSRAKNPNEPIEVQGHKMFLDSTDSLELLTREVYHPLLTDLVKKEVKEGDVVLDIGAHIGYFTLIFAKLVGKKGKVFAFEPEPNNFELLRKNVETNGYKNVVLVQRAVSNKNEKNKLYLSKDCSGMHKIKNSGHSRYFIQMKTIKLDDYFKNYDGNIDFIKMDIEGAEAWALEGMSLLLARSKKVKIITEFYPLAFKEFNIKSKEFLNFFIKHGFKFYDLNEEKGKIEPIKISELVKIYTLEKKNSTNLLCLRKNDYVNYYFN